MVGESVIEFAVPKAAKPVERIPKLPGRHHYPNLIALDRGRPSSQPGRLAEAVCLSQQGRAGGQIVSFVPDGSQGEEAVDGCDAARTPFPAGPVEGQLGQLCSLVESISSQCQPGECAVTELAFRAGAARAGCLGVPAERIFFAEPQMSEGHGGRELGPEHRVQTDHPRWNNRTWPGATTPPSGIMSEVMDVRPGPVGVNEHSMEVGVEQVVKGPEQLGSCKQTGRQFVNARGSFEAPQRTGSIRQTHVPEVRGGEDIRPPRIQAPCIVGEVTDGQPFPLGQVPAIQTVRHFRGAECEGVVVAAGVDEVAYGGRGVAPAVAPGRGPPVGLLEQQRMLGGQFVPEKLEEQRVAVVRPRWPRQPPDEELAAPTNPPGAHRCPGGAKPQLRPRW